MPETASWTATFDFVFRRCRRRHSYASAVTTERRSDRYKHTQTVTTINTALAHRCNMPDDENINGTLTCKSMRSAASSMARVKTTDPAIEIAIPSTTTLTASTSSVVIATKPGEMWTNRGQMAQAVATVMLFTNFGARRDLLACSNEYAIAINAGSLHAAPTNDSPHGRPLTNPAGTVICG